MTDTIEIEVNELDQVRRRLAELEKQRNENYWRCHMQGSMRGYKPLPRAFFEERDRLERRARELRRGVEDARVHGRPKSRYRHYSPMVAKAARELYFVGRLRQWEIAKIFGAKQHTVSRWLNRKTWTDGSGVAL